MEITADDIASRFNSINWHDSKLRSFSLRRIPRGDIIEILCEINGGGGYRSAKITIIDPIYLVSDIYISAKRACADDISGASCNIESSWIVELSKRYMYDDFSGYLHFEITLIPPGGIMNVLAADFSLDYIS